MFRKDHDRIWRKWAKKRDEDYENLNKAVVLHISRRLMESASHHQTYNDEGPLIIGLMHPHYGTTYLISGKVIHSWFTPRSLPN